MYRKYYTYNLPLQRTNNNYNSNWIAAFQAHSPGRLLSNNKCNNIDHVTKWMLCIEILPSYVSATSSTPPPARPIRRRSFEGDLIASPRLTLFHRRPPPRPDPRTNPTTSFLMRFSRIHKFQPIAHSTTLISLLNTLHKLWYNEQAKL